jgi:hypothetical protein
VLKVVSAMKREAKCRVDGEVGEVEYEDGVVMRWV